MAYGELHRASLVGCCRAVGRQLDASAIRKTPGCQLRALTLPAGNRCAAIPLVEWPRGTDAKQVGKTQVVHMASKGAIVVDMQNLRRLRNRDRGVRSSRKRKKPNDRLEIVQVVCSCWCKVLTRPSSGATQPVQLSHRDRTNGRRREKISRANARLWIILTNRAVTGMPSALPDRLAHHREPILAKGRTSLLQM